VTFDHQGTAAVSVAVWAAALLIVIARAIDALATKKAVLLIANGSPYSMVDRLDWRFGSGEPGSNSANHELGCQQPDF
jgi:hypothetical protein